MRLTCEDCGKDYDQFGIDTVIPNAQWNLIHPEREGGILCASCMVLRASKISSITVAHMIFEVTPPLSNECDRCGRKSDVVNMTACPFCIIQ